MLTTAKRTTLAFTVFAMFFGAGNLIFPVFLAFQSGGDFPLAFSGFALSAIGLPILALLASMKAGGLEELARRVSPAFSKVFTVVVYLAIGPCLAIPRTASTSHEMVALATGMDSAIARFVYCALFFLLAALLARRPERLSNRLGRILSPTLVILIAVLTVGSLTTTAPSLGQWQYASHPLQKGFLEGYQTMDTLAALNFGLIIALNVQALGVKSTEGVVSETVKAGMIAGFFLITIYLALAHIGATVGGAGLITENGAQTLTSVAKIQFGSWGIILLGMIFFVACLNTCVGLLSCCSDYFTKVFPVLSYKGWLLVFVLCSMVVSNAGLTLILKLSIPVLMAIYPVALMLIILGLTHRFNQNFSNVYPFTITMTAIVSIAGALKDIGLEVPLLNHLPFYSIGLEWVTPAIIGWVVGIFYSKRRFEI